MSAGLVWAWILLIFGGVLALWAAFSLACALLILPCRAIRYRLQQRRWRRYWQTHPYGPLPDWQQGRAPRG